MKIPSVAWLVFLPLAGVLAWFLPIVLLGDSLEGNSTAAILSSLSLIVLFAGILAFTIWWFWQYAKAVEKATNGEVSPILTVVLMVFVDEIALFILQHFFNKIEDNSSDHIQPPEAVATQHNLND